MRLLTSLYCLLVASVAGAQAPPEKDVEWPTYAADLAGTRYRPLDQINASNFDDLEIAWRIKTDSFGDRPEYKLEGTPLMVNRVLYATAGSRRSVIAVDPENGQLLWIHQEREGKRGDAAPRQLSGRGLAYWSDGKQERILYVTPGYRLICLDAKTGTRVRTFGHDGIVDLKLDDDQKILPDLETGEIGTQAAPVVAKNTIIVGAAFREGMTPKSMRNNKGYVRGFDVRTGKRLWIFHTIPQKSEPGYDTWLDGSAEYTGNTGMWTQTTVDEKLGLAYLPIESPTSDLYGGHRRGNDLYAESLVCVDLVTGKRRWHFQLVHHPLWDMDIPAAPILADVVVDGKPVKAVAQPTKQGILYVFDRVTGKPLWPMPEAKVPVGNVPGEWYSPTQPMPEKPRAYARNGISVDDLIDFTPTLRKKALEVVSHYVIGPLFTPPAESKLGGPLGTFVVSVTDGGTGWPGGAYDPETHLLYVYGCNACSEVLGLVPSPPGMSDVRYVMGTAGHEVVPQLGVGERRAPVPGKKAKPQAEELDPTTLDELPIIKPPYSLITAINLDKGDFAWQIVHGDTLDEVRNSPLLKGMKIPRTGQLTWGVGPLVTKSLLIAGEARFTTTPDHPRGAMLRAYDKGTGKEVGAVFMPAPESGSPMTYMLNGRQYIVIAVGGGPYSGEYIAYALPTRD